MKFAYQGPALAGGNLGEVIPKAADVQDVGTPGVFYRPKDGESIYGISKRAYGTATPGIYRIRDSKWNAYIRQGKSGWENYNTTGPMLEPKYSNAPARSPHGSGNSLPWIWIPPFDSSEPEPDEPDEPTIPYFGPFIPSGPAPDTAPPKLTPKEPKPGPGPTPGPTPGIPKKKKKKTAPPEVTPPKKKKKKADEKIVYVPVEVPVPVPCPECKKQKKRKQFDPMVVGLIGLGIGVVVAADRNKR